MAFILSMFRISLFLLAVLLNKISFAQSENLGEIYSIGIQFRLDELPNKKVFIADTITEHEFSMTTRQCIKLFKQYFYYKDSSGVVTADNLDSMNNTLQDIFKQYKFARLISGEERNKLFGKGVSEEWSSFYERYPGYAGIIYLSPVYFNQQYTKALYQLSLANQPCGNGRNSLIFLKKDKAGKWHKTIP